MSTDQVELAKTALLEVTPETTVGAFVGTVDEGDGVTSVLFANRMPGYPGWRWTVSVAHVGSDEPTVLEVELMPGDGSLVAPAWVPWSERLADYRAAQGADAAAAGDQSDDDDDDDDDDDIDDDDLEDDGLDDNLDDDELDDVHSGADDDELDEIVDGPRGAEADQPETGR